MNNLDSRDGIKTVDPENMHGAIATFPDQIRKAVAIGRTIDVNPSDYAGIRKIILCGMGGSAIGGDLGRSLLRDVLPVPMLICRDYVLPVSAGEDALVIGSSYSGNTEETLAAFGEAIERKCRLFALTTGGKLGGLAAGHEIPVAQLPSGLQPRAALGYSFVPLMLFFHKIGLSPYDADRLMALADFLETRARLLDADQPSSENAAKQLAMRLYGRIPVIYSGPGLTEAVAVRIKGQISENGKMLAFANQFPECNHNELVGWKVLNTFRDYLRVVILRDREDHPRVKARMDIVKEMIVREKVEVIEIESEGLAAGGDDRPERMFSLIQLGDFASFYLAMLNNIDPTPVAAIDFLKDELAKIG